MVFQIKIRRLEILRFKSNIKFRIWKFDFDPAKFDTQIEFFKIIKILITTKFFY